MEEKKRAGRPATITDEGDRKQKYAASLTPNQYKRMLSAFPPSRTSSSFEQCVLFALMHKEKESL